MEQANQDSPPPTKSRLWDVCIRLNLEYDVLQSMDELVGVPAKTMENMVLGHPVGQTAAEKILAVFSQQTGFLWTFENLDIPLSEESQKHKSRMFFTDLWRIQGLRADVIAPHAFVSEDIVYAMVRNAPVAKADAERVLAYLSSALKQEYTLETVYVSLLEEGEQDATKDHTDQ